MLKLTDLCSVVLWPLNWLTSLSCGFLSLRLDIFPEQTLNLIHSIFLQLGFRNQDKQLADFSCSPNFCNFHYLLSLSIIVKNYEPSRPEMQSWFYHLLPVLTWANTIISLSWSGFCNSIHIIGPGRELNGPISWNQHNACHIVKALKKYMPDRTKLSW